MVCPRPRREKHEKLLRARVPGVEIRDENGRARQQAKEKRADPSRQRALRRLPDLHDTVAGDDDSFRQRAEDARVRDRAARIGMAQVRRRVWRAGVAERG